MTTFFSVDVETTGPVPGLYDLLSIGCVAVKHQDGVISYPLEEGDFYYTVKQDHDLRWEQTTWDWWRAQNRSIMAEALYGDLPIKAVFNNFMAWVGRTEPLPGERCFVAHPVGFDWAWINYHFHEFFSHNPFGHRPLCLRSMKFGMDNKGWGQERSEENPYFFESEYPHHALYDAKAQALTLIAQLQDKPV